LLERPPLRLEDELLRLDDFFDAPPFLAAAFFVEPPFFAAPFFVDPPFFGAPFDEPLFFGTFSPFSLASDKPIAIACFRDVTFLPLRPLFNFPSCISCMVFSTFLPAPLEYLAI
jgi:hypothetical protein